MDTDTAPAPPRSAAIDGAAPQRSSGRHRVFLGATAVVALHVVDDNFLQPAAGTSALDHLASGLVPLALLALGGWFYLRVRAGARALIAIAVGLFGVMIGAFEAGYYSVAVGPSGDDYTGLLAIPAGLVLVGVGVRCCGAPGGVRRGSGGATAAGSCSGWWASLRSTSSSSPSAWPTWRPMRRAPSYQTPTSVRRTRT